MINKKKCSKCKVVKSLDLFYNNKAAKDGKMACCKECQNERVKRYNQTEKGQVVAKIAGDNYNRSEKGKKVKNEASRRHSQTDKGRKSRSEAGKRHYRTEEGKKASSKRSKKYSQTEKGKASAKRYRQSDKGKEWLKKQYTEHTQVAIRCLLRAHVRDALNNYSKIGKIMSSKKCGIDYNVIIKHLGPHPNILGIKGKFHIDHKYPLSLFDLNNPEHIKIAFDPENHQWLLEEENLKKGNKIPKRNEIPKALSKKLDCIGIKI